MYLYVIAGLLLFLAEPPFGLWPLGFVALIPVLHAAHRARSYRSAALGGFIAGVTFFAPGLFWLTSTTVIGWAALAVYCATYVAVFALLALEAGSFWSSYAARLPLRVFPGFFFHILSTGLRRSPRFLTSSEPMDSADF
jgi:apolipoprotein N-acyltransferase